MSQSDQYQSAPPPAYPAEQPGYGQPAYGQPGYQPQKTNTMAILGLVFAFVFSPLGVVFSAIGLKQIKQRREGGRGLALAGLIISILSLVIGILLIVAFATVLAPVVEKAAQSGAAAAAGSDDATGVVGACKVIVPAGMTLESDLAKAQGPEDFAAVISTLRTTIEGAAGQTTDPAFTAHVQKFSADLQQIVDTAANGEDPSSLEPVLNADGTQIDNDCAAAGYVQ